MRFLYVAPRYHTNQIPIMKGLTENGDSVCFVSHYQGTVEDYSYVKPVIAGYSSLFLLENAIYLKLHKKNSHAGDMKLKFGFPSARRIRHIVRDFKPEVMIIRERSVYSIVVCQACRHMKIPMILYNQSPLWENEIKKDFPHRVVKKLLPAVRITPVLGKQDVNKEKEDNAFFVPFVMEPRLSSEDKTWFQQGMIHILCVGKYEKRKNIAMLLEIIDEIRDHFPIKLTVAGECSSEFHKAYYKEQQIYIQEHHLEQHVTLLKNLKRSEMDELYAGADLFVIPSTAEPASISQLEAMAFSTPVICSDQNGSACYVKHGVTGYLFRDNDRIALKEALQNALEDREGLQQMGKMGYNEIKEHCSFQEYYRGIQKCLQRIGELEKGKKII